MIGKVIVVIILHQFPAAKADCDSLPTIANTYNNATGSGPFVTGTVIRFDCDDGFNPAGTKREYRCSGAQWVEGDFRCEEIFCSYVETPENGRLMNEPSNQVGTTIRFDCNEGYNMVGESNQMICLINGEWQPEEPPQCEIKMCGEFGSIQYGSVFQDSSYTVRNGYGSIVEVTCDENYIVKGNPRVMCKVDGNWDVKPTCVKSTCPLYPGLNSSCIKETNPFGNYLFLSCRDDVPVTKKGPDQAECISGAWDNTDIACYCDCKVEADLKTVSLNNVGNNGYLSHEAKLKWDCKKNYEKYTTSNLHCYDGNIIKPVCKSKVTAKPVTVTYKPVTDKKGSTVNPPPTTTWKTLSSETVTNKPVTDKNGRIVHSSSTPTWKPFSTETVTNKTITDKNGSTVNPTPTTTWKTLSSITVTNKPVTDKNGRTVNSPSTLTWKPFSTETVTNKTVTDKNGSTVNPPPTTTRKTLSSGTVTNKPVTDKNGRTVNSPSTPTLKPFSTETVTNKTITDKNGSAVNPTPTTTWKTLSSITVTNKPVTDKNGSTVNPPPTTTWKTFSTETVTNKTITDKNGSTSNLRVTTTDKPLPRNYFSVIIGVIGGTCCGLILAIILTVCCLNTKCIITRKFCSKENGKSSQNAEKEQKMSM